MWERSPVRGSVVDESVVRHRGGVIHKPCTATCGGGDLLFSPTSTLGVLRPTVLSESVRASFA